ncbi:class I lanthipeptide [Flavobacterium sp. ZS1P70]|uniref:Class I lanthipeptide n=1 Tax=Flavobacterium zhoui TaxID=3230414 RepID=A0ABW6I7A9_9FLAO
MKIKLSKGLSLNKETVSKLQESQMAHIKGGNVIEDSWSCVAGTCNASCNKGTCNG